MSAAGRKLRRYFLTGLVVLAPVGVTAVVLAWMFRTIDDILGDPLQIAIGVRIPGLGFALLFAAVMIVGWVVHFAAGRQLLHLWNEALARFPVAGRVYTAMSQIVQSVVGEQRLPAERYRPQLAARRTQAFGRGKRRAGFLLKAGKLRLRGRVEPAARAIDVEGRRAGRERERSRQQHEAHGS